MNVRPTTLLLLNPMTPLRLSTEATVQHKRARGLLAVSSAWSRLHDLDKCPNRAETCRVMAHADQTRFAQPPHESADLPGTHPTVSEAQSLVLSSKKKGTLRY